jgi:hypothetical protein
MLPKIPERASFVVKACESAIIADAASAVAAIRIDELRKWLRIEWPKGELRKEGEGKRERRQKEYVSENTYGG